MYEGPPALGTGGNGPPYPHTQTQREALPMSDPLPLRPFQPAGEPVEQPTLFTDHPLTVRQVVDWYWTNNVRRYCPIALKERRRIQALFVAMHGDRLCCQCRPLDLLEFVNQQQGIKSDWSRKRWATTLQ